MQLAIYDPNDDLFAYLVGVAARRRGHLAKQVTELTEISRVFTTAPSMIILGVSQVDETVLQDIESLHSLNNRSLIMVAAEAGRTQLVLAALERGAADVVYKPLLPNDLVIRAEYAAANRGVSNNPDGALTVGDLSVDIEQAIATKAGRDMTLTRMELRLLYCLLQHRGRIAPTERLLSFAWESDEFATSSLKTHISHLRHEIEEAGGMPVTIKARQMLGYVFDLVEVAATP